MKDMGLLEMRREGKHNFYFIPSHAHQLIQQLFAVVDDTNLTPTTPASDAAVGDSL